MKFSIKNFFSKCDKIRSFLRIWSHLLKKSVMENFILIAVIVSLSWKNLIKTLSFESNKLEKFWGTTGVSAL